jgi:hypothetical protein
MRVLVCPLDWGLGHATRCIPLIRALRDDGHEVVLGASGGGLRLLRAEFPDLESFDFPGYPVRYSRSAATLLPVLLAQLPGLLLGMLRERKALERAVRDRGIDLVVSDGRYGVRTRLRPSIFITHQVFIRIPGNLPGTGFAERLLFALNRRLLKRFREVWIPDYPGRPNLSGDLSHKPCDLPNLAFIGPLSRFGTNEEASGEPLPAIDLLASVSGPEPQRTRFETLLRDQLRRRTGTRVLIRGLPGLAGPDRSNPGRIVPGELNEFPHLDGRTMERLFASAKAVVARSGYTTVMEMAALGLAKVIVVPTPGQSEQEYLADHLDRARIALRAVQEELELDAALAALEGYSGFAPFSAAAGGAPGGALPAFLGNHPLFGGSRRG